MFNIDAEPSFTDTVKVRLPGGEEESFKATFRVLDVDTVGAFDLANGEGTREFLEAAILSMDDIVDGKNARIAYSPDLRDRVLKMPHVRTALVRCYIEGISKAAEGN